MHAIDHKKNKNLVDQFKNKSMLKIHSLILNVKDYPFENETVDIIIVNQILEHCKDFWIFHEISRVLKVMVWLSLGFLI